MDHPSNRRAFTRVKISLAVELAPDDQPKIAGLGRDLSIKGVYVESARQLPTDTRCPVTIILTGAPEPMYVRVSGRVAFAGSSGMGIEFLDMDVDSFIHLKNLVLYNSLDAEKIEQELQSHIGLKRAS